ncbi:DUF5686 and carboxypeptidase regulatory-like domain-containing protein [Flavobacterium sp. MFBS3-15]|uniref:DUF5686 and carboxypeptidase regulatory-like domain-containing protein n=1 Tax=Flavobacterium sp. MFBS3-15 TaxID=2989816 RepID=UPI0022360EA4|nr:DUF5686 and carboxypeptidase regulatory-like domain-containing protein [Flavobacterium sp. MFBS3-15]MCW4468594.1 DUF5686 and carboxypeptidase regulatory-like domain-containing protein [Flavobacterium sp. MFBS3-15]
MRILTLLLFFFTLTSQAQTAITIKVKDAGSNAPLPFATIESNGKSFITDVDGKLALDKPGKTITISYTGYGEQKFSPEKGKRFYTIKLQPYTEELKEVVVNASNPANEIIGRAIRRKPMNDPQQKLESFRYKTYDRLIVTANPDSISGKIDSVFTYERAGRVFQKIDSSGFKFKKIIDKQHLYQTEKVSEFKFNKEQGLKEDVLATRMAGFKKPLYEFIGLKLQSYSVYSNKIDLFETKYAGPLAYDALQYYNYSILDTVLVDNRSTYMVYFVPKRNSKKKLKGLLYIDRNNYGVAKAVLRVKNMLDITSTHYFTFEEGQQLWFPDKKTLQIVKGNNKEDIKILGETIKFDAVTNDKRKKESSDYVYLLSESSNFEKEFNIPLTIRRTAVAIEIRDEATNRPEEYWNKFRTDTLDARSHKTYIALDSIVAKDNWEQRIILGRKIVNGYLPVGAFDIDLRQIAKYNNYEGFRLGIGGITNDRFLEIFRLSGYGAYGTKDGQFKYSFGGALRLGNFSNSWVGVSYTDDVKEIGSTSFATDKRVFKIYDPRPINISTFYNHQTWMGYIETKIIPKTESMWQVTRSRIDPKFDYTYAPNGDPFTVFHLTTASVALQWNPFSDFMQTPIGRLETEKRFPKFAIQYTQSVAGLLDSDFTFGKLDFRAEFEQKYLNGQKTAALIQTGIAVGNTPLTHLYSTSPNNLDKDGVLERITLAGKNSFETMYFNEFFSSQYMMVQLKHGLTRFTIFRALKLSPMLVTRFAWGNMEKKEEHIGLQYNTLEKGYYESGLEFNEIFKGLGLSAFYRYGPYHLPYFDRNISVKVSFVLNLF